MVLLLIGTSRRRNGKSDLPGTHQNPTVGVFSQVVADSRCTVVNVSATYSSMSSNARSKASSALATSSATTPTA